MAEADDALRRELVEVLSRAGFSAVGVPHGAAALDYLRTHSSPRLVLSDLRMPVMSGGELRDRLQADPALKDLPVVALASRDARSSTPDPRFAALLHKPVAVSDLVAIAARFCR